MKVYIRSRRRAMSQSGHPALTSLPNGDVVGNTFGPAGEMEVWTLQKIKDDNCKLTCVTLQASNGLYLSASPDGDVDAAARTVGADERWFLRNCDDGCVALMSFHGRYLVNDCRFDCGRFVRADREQLCDWSKWILVDDPKAMTTKTPVGKVAVAGVYTAALFMPILGAIGAVTLVKRSMVYGGSENGFSIVVLNERGNLMKEWIEFKTEALTEAAVASACEISNSASKVFGSLTSGSGGGSSRKSSKRTSQLDLEYGEHELKQQPMQISISSQ